jgi:hypothetical protein
MYCPSLDDLEAQRDPSINPQRSLAMSKHDFTDLEDDEKEPDRGHLGALEYDRLRSSSNLLRRLEVQHWVGLFFITIGITGIGFVFIAIPSTR